jgi:hypothetical protein
VSSSLLVVPDAERTLAAIEQRGWLVVLLKPRSKCPLGQRWFTTRDLDRIRGHLRSGGNVGLVCGPESGIAVPDFDDPGTAEEMFERLGPLPRWVESQPGRFHCYVRWQPSLPAKLRWQGRLVGELQRGPAHRDQVTLQQVVMPPSVHPSSGLPYRWLVEPTTQPLQAIPMSWAETFLPTERAPLSRQARRGSVVDCPPRPTSPGVWQAALRQPGASLRCDRVKFQCPACREEGHDRHRDNAVAFANGSWGCAFSRDHWEAVGRTLGMLWRDGIRFADGGHPWH